MNYQTLMQMKRCLILILGTIFVLCGCSPISRQSTPAEPTSLQPGNQPPQDSMPVITQNVELQATLSIYHSWSEDNRLALDAILRDFSKRYPSIYFDITYIPADELHELYVSQASRGKSPSLLFGPVEWGWKLWDAGLIHAMDGVIEAGIIENLNPAALESSRYQGNLISLPYALHGPILYRNQDLMTIRADTFDEMVMLAQSASQGEITGAYLERSFYFSAAHLYGLGGSLMDSNGYPAFLTPQGEAWLRLLSAFQYAGKTAFLSDLDLEDFKAGRAGWIIEGSWKMGELAESIGADRLKVDPWPEVENGRLSGFVQSDNLYLNSNVDQRTLEAAKAFLEFFSSQIAQSRLVEVNLIPALLYMDMPRTDLSPVIAQAMTAMADGTAYPVSPGIDTYSLYMDRAIQANTEKGISATAALKEASEAIIEEISETNLTATP